jgi:superfamily II DNA or RNA helicase
MSSTVKNKQTKLSKELLDHGQNEAIDRLYNCDETMLVAGMGAGKTIISLTAIQELIADGVLDRVIVFAPLKVAKEVWIQEARKWEHTAGMRIVFCTGSPAKRVNAVEYMQGEKGILIMNFDIMAWFFETYKRAHGFDGLLIDELSKLKGGGKGFKKMRRNLDSFKWLVGMTGTPVSEDFEGLFYQVYTLDKGARFGGRKDKFLDEFFTTDYNGYDWTLRPDGAERIIKLLSELVYTVPDYRHTLPELVKHTAVAELPSSVMALYKNFSKTCVIELDGEVAQTADNAAVLSGKLQQLASGALYMDDEVERSVHTLHHSKMAVVERLVSQVDGPVVVCYWFKHELERLERLFPEAVNLNAAGANDAWNRGEIDVLLVQPVSCSHGLQLQFGGHNLIFFAPIWSNDIVEQMIARLWRKGQRESVHVWEIVAVGTVDELIIDRVAGKKRFDRLFHSLIHSVDGLAVGVDDANHAVGV